MKINPLQANRSIVKDEGNIPVDNTNANNINSPDSKRLDVNDIVSLSKKAKELADKKTGNERYASENLKNTGQKDEKNVKPAENLLIMANRYLHHYINDNNDPAIKIIDKDTKKVVSEIPPEQVQKLKTAINKIADEMGKIKDGSNNN